MKIEGLKEAEVQSQREKYGSNKLTQLENDPLWKKVLEGFKDPMIMILLFALVIQVVFLCLGEGHWYEVVGIAVAILVANLVAVFSEGNQEKKAQELRAEVQSKEKAKVVRDGKLSEIPIDEVVVGDVVLLQSGDKIPADGVVISGHIKVDQATLNGETKEADKYVVEDADFGSIKDLLNKFYVYRGTVTCDGECYVEVKVVGDSTFYGNLALEMQEETRETPLQVKLGVLAGQISKFGYIGASFIAGSYILQTVVLAGNIPDSLLGWGILGIDALSLAVVIVVMAVPEGLPMMISMVLALNMGKMMKDNVLVRKLNGIETAGGINILFTDKTGTITEGKLSVVEVATGDVVKYNSFEDLTHSLKMDMEIGIGVNNSATCNGDSIIGGNSTDRALMAFVVSGDNAVDKAEVKNFNSFDSSKKYSSVVISNNGKDLCYIKGAPEKIIARCTRYKTSDGKLLPLTELNYLESYMNEQASRSMRLLAVAYSESGTDDGDLILLGVLSIRDNVRSTSTKAIAEVQRAGVQVVMVTGDRKETAVAIAKESGLFKSNTDIALTSSEMELKTDEELQKLLPNLRVVARALPTDKSRLVRVAQELNLVVAMTGDGVNDAPALKKADVGFAMGSGTEVAKEASEIVIMDDNFLSIEKAILYGRTIFKNIRKFLIFQLTVNVSAVALCFLAPLLGIEQPISILSLLFINLVMDTFAALAFGNEPANLSFMKETPINRDDSILTKRMISQILTTGVFIVIGSLCILLFEPLVTMYSLGMPVSLAYKETVMLVFLMLTVILNGFYARTNTFNVFDNIGKNKSFIYIMIGVTLMLVLLVNVLYLFAGLEVITLYSWCVAIMLSVMSIPVDMLRKYMVK